MASTVIHNPYVGRYARWAADLVERAVRTFAQALLAYFVTAHVTGFLAVNWKAALSVAGFAAAASILTTLSTIGISSKTSASVVPSVNGNRSR